jgi:uncharacterized protein YdaL
MRLIVVSLGVLLAWAALAFAQDSKKVLIVVEGKTDIKSVSIGDGRHLANLLGHFHAVATVQGVDDYLPHSLQTYDRVFYVGFNAHNRVPDKFLADVMGAAVPVTWLHTGFREFCAAYPVEKKFGFTVTQLDSVGGFSVVEHAGATFTKEEPNINIVNITDRARVSVIAQAFSPRTKRRIPYIVQSGTFTYIADCPFASTSPTDRYILFADLLHDLMDEQHEESHTALIRIEDINPMANPDRLRDVADLLSARGIPFLVGVSPIYVNPGEGQRISLSEKPEVVDALKYMVRNGGTIVMHGVTHQYKGVTGDDFEFWDASAELPIKGETVEGIQRKMEMGIQEFMKNGLYPLIWETPHYGGSFQAYRVIAQFFSSAMEQRLTIENIDYGQYFPYMIYRDLFGQKIYPENLGYVPLLPTVEESRKYVDDIIRGARANLSVRDGFASNFFHPFLDLSLLAEIVDSVQGMGYTYADVRDDTNWVKTRDRIILTGSQTYRLTLADQYLAETKFDEHGEVISKDISANRFTGPVERTVELEEGQFYKAEPTEFREHKIGLVEQMVSKVERTVGNFLARDDQWQEARPLILWNQFARGAAFNDQASLAAAYGCVGIRVDTLFLGQPLVFGRHNLLIVPFAFVDSLALEEYATIVNFVKDGGNLVTDMKNFLAEDFGIRFSTTTLRVARIIDRMYPEELMTWRVPELLTKFEADEVDELFCIDNATEAPLMIGKKWGSGKLIFIATRFDPSSQLGYSLYPYLLEHSRTYFGLAPVIRREALEMYFDNGFRHNISIEQLVQQWVRQGIRRVHAAGWHMYPKYTYDYKRLISTAHANGILVYAWLEPPQVSQKFWQEHPEWREKNYKGEDVLSGWRYPVAMTDDRCVTAMVEEYARILDTYDWDGVNISEVYFGGDRGFNDPQNFAPMHPSARDEVRWLYGFDLATIFDPHAPAYWKTRADVRNDVVAYRVAQIEEVYRRMLRRCDEIAHRREGFEVFVTALDSYGSPELRENNGVDMTSILSLQREFGFALQVEDPATRWSTDPMRYVAMGAQYREHVGGDHALMLDLNILNIRQAGVITPFPTLIQTGTECFQIVRAAALGAPRSTIYAESSINPQDMKFLASAYAAQVRCEHTDNGYHLESPYSFTMKFPRAITEVMLDGVVLSPFRDNQYMIPAGSHDLGMSQNVAGSLSAHQFFPHIMSITGNLLSYAYAMRTVDFEYTSDGRCLVSLSSEPHEVLIDGTPHTFYSMRGDDCFSLLLPAGRHKVEVVAGDSFSYGINVTSFWSTTAIAAFGAVAVVALIGMYLVVRIRRGTVRLDGSAG